MVGNYSKALAILEPLAAQGDDCAQFQLGQMYKLGQSAKQDKANALELFQMVAAQGNKNAKIQAEFLLKY